jgi:hypothetical protein
MSREGRNRDGRNPEEWNPEWQHRKDQGRACPAPGHALLEETYRKYHLAQAGVLARRDQPVARAAVARGRRRARIALAAAAVAMIVALGALAARHMASLGATHPASRGPARPSAATLARDRAAEMAGEQASAWVAAQVSGHTTVACDPAMCAALAARGFPTLGLTLLRPQDLLTGSGLGGSELVVVTATVRHEFGPRLARLYAPEVIATFGTGAQQVQVRTVATDGAAAYLARAGADLTARKAAGSQLLRNPSVGASPAARAQIAAGQVDSRLLMMLATMAAAEPIQVRSFGDPDPGAGAGQPLRSADIAAGAAGARGAGLGRLLAFARAQRPPYQPARASIIAAGHGRSVLIVEFAAPSPLGLLPATGA